MKAIHIPGATLAAAVALALSLVGCAPGPLAPGSNSGSSSIEGTGSNSEGPTATPSPTSSGVATVVPSVQPDPLIDLDCSDFAGVASIGTIAGVTERDPRGVVAENVDVVALADIVRTAGGIACEFSDGGAWRVTNAEGGYALNTAWRGAAIFIVPNVGAASDDLLGDGACGEPVNNRTSLCLRDFMVGSSWVTVVSSTNDRRATISAVFTLVESIVAGATSKAGPIVHARGTFQPPRDCALLVPTAEVASLLGGSDVVVDRPIQLNVAAEATFVTENIGCQWYRDTGDSAAQVQVFPGGGWAADLTLSGLDTTPIELVGLRDGDRALSHCTDVSAYGFSICTVEMVVDGTWVRGIGSGPDQAISTEIAVAVAESALTHRD